MAGLLTNLIERQRGTAMQVEPRPRSQYESNEAIAGADSPGDDPAVNSTSLDTGIGNAVPDNQTQAPAKPGATPQAAMPAAKPAQSGLQPHQVDAKPLDDLSPHLKAEPEPSAKRVPPRPESDSPDDQKLANGHTVTTRSATDAPAPPAQVDDLDQRIAAVLAQLPAPNYPPASAPALIEPPAIAPIESAGARADVDTPPPRHAQQADIPLVSPVPGKQHWPDSSPTAQPAQPGVLETPAWLNELQAGLNRQRAQRNAPEPPTVNVTIGRVEVKALRAPEPQKPARKKKASTVMSLDDYLQQRGGDG